MTKSKSYVPEGFRSVTPYLVCRGVARLIEFLKSAFGAVEIARMGREDGSIAHACVKIGDSMVEMGEAQGELARSMTAALHLYVADCDAAWKAAMAAGASSLSEPKDQFYGERSAGIVDVSGNHWYIATHQEDLTAEELASRMAGPGESVK